MSQNVTRFDILGTKVYIEYTGSIAKVGRQEGGCPMDCRLKTKDGHYQMALGAMRSSLYLNQ